MHALTVRSIASRLAVAVAAVGIAFLPAACDKETTAPILGVAGNTTLSTNATIASAVSGIPFSFPAGAGAISPSLAGQNLTVTFGGTATATTATLAFNAGSATTTVVYGSCVFAVTNITGTVGSLHVGDTITVNPCNLNVATTGAVANGVATSRSVALVLGAASSAGATVTVGVNAGGSLTLNGTQVGTVTLVPISG